MFDRPGKLISNTARQVYSSMSLLKNGFLPSYLAINSLQHSFLCNNTVVYLILLMDIFVNTYWSKSHNIKVLVNMKGTENWVCDG